MGRRELVEALHREGEEVMAAIVARGAAEEERLRSGVEQRREELMREHEQQRELLCSGRQRLLMSRAVREAALIRLRAEYALSLRLRERSLRCLRQLGTASVEQNFRSLAAELPLESWRTVQVNPGNSAIAALCFPASEIVADPEICGGLRAETTDGRLTVDNTLEMRLERIWPDLLPEFMAELRGYQA
ncbi:MAG: V-type ATP synthase subunit E family protein [Desulfuromonadaceae bacterium]|nr:V-type ATP synthase subunit E family protein [Desulfuromonadaceae bacterium]